MRRCLQTGFTLIEMTIVIVLTGIVALLASRNIAEPIRGFIDLSRRAALVDEAEISLSRITREIRLALPNSVRITDGTTQNLTTCAATAGASCAVEILRTLDGSRYREQVDGVGGGDTLDFSLANDTFDIMGTLPNVAQIDEGATDESDCINGNSDCIVIYNLGQGGANAYNGENIAGIAADGDADNDGVLDSPFAFSRTVAGTPFPFSSPNQRFHIVDTPVSFVCDSANDRIIRYDEYAIAALQSLTPGGTASLLAGNVESCVFRYNQGAGSRNAVLTIELNISQTNRAGNAERVRLVQQVRVPNIP